jgi:glucosamine-6-phosphate deaminase
MDIQIAENRAQMGQAAGIAVAAALRAKIESSGSVTIAFAAAPSQNETLATLADEPGIAWNRVTAFHLDEYVGSKPDSPYAFRRYLREHIFHRVTPAAFHPIRGEAGDMLTECERYAALLPKNGFDIALLGIGENGHLAFNDPPCDFSDPAKIKVVNLDEACRVQQVHDGAFPTLNDVPRQAFTLTVPALMSAQQIFIMVPGLAKAKAVAASVEGPVTSECPGSILRTHTSAQLFLDRDSAALLKPKD